MAATPEGSDGRLHPNKVLAAIQDRLGDNAIVINDGGDFLAFGRIGLSAPTMLDPEAISSDGKTGLARVPDLQPVAAWDGAERKWREGS